MNNKSEKLNYVVVWISVSDFDRYLTIMGPRRRLEIHCSVMQRRITTSISLFGREGPTTPEYIWTVSLRSVNNLLCGFPVPVLSGILALSVPGDLGNFAVPRGIVTSRFWFNCSVEEAQQHQNIYERSVWEAQIICCVDFRFRFWAVSYHYRSQARFENSLFRDAASYYDSDLIVLKRRPNDTNKYLNGQSEKRK